MEVLAHIGFLACAVKHLTNDLDGLRAKGFIGESMDGLEMTRDAFALRYLQIKNAAWAIDYKPGVS